MRRPFDPQEAPTRRSLRIFAFDPMLGRESDNRITIDVPYEEIAPGPVGERIHVIDYDSATGQYYEPVDLNDSRIAMQHGLAPSESDPRFHQQMAYAVTMKVIENFDVALGRRLTFRKQRPLRVFPHGARMANACYQRDLHALVFGTFRSADSGTSVGVPGQTIYTCLSHDIVAHEVTHALVDRLRPLFMEPTNEDVIAFHEAFSDIVAIFQHFAFPDILRRTIQTARTDLRQASPLVELASEFGYATGQGTALRRAIDRPDAGLYKSVEEPHERGSLLVAAVFDGFFNAYQGRIADLLRIATGGTGKLPEGDLHPDLVNRIASEATRMAQRVLTMCIRAFEYLPPIDINFGDYLRALVTADFELSPLDPDGVRLALIKGFQARGILPDDVTSLAEQSLLWDGGDELPRLDINPLLGDIFEQAQRFSVTANAPRSKAPGADAADEAGDWDGSGDVNADVSRLLQKYAADNALRLGLDPDSPNPIAVLGFHPAFRFTPQGQLLIEIVAQFAQTPKSRAAYMAGRPWNGETTLGGVPTRGAATIVAAADGTVRYAITKPLPSARSAPRMQRLAQGRLDRQERYLAAFDLSDARRPWAAPAYAKTRLAKSFDLAALHVGRCR